MWNWNHQKSNQLFILKLICFNDWYICNCKVTSQTCWKTKIKYNFLFSLRYFFYKKLFTFINISFESHGMMALMADFGSVRLWAVTYDSALYVVPNRTGDYIRKILTANKPTSGRKKESIVWKYFSYNAVANKCTCCVTGIAEDDVVAVVQQRYYLFASWVTLWHNCWVSKCHSKYMYAVCFTI
jgi:hypothetical protein